MHVDGRRLRTGDPRSAIAAGIAHVPEDRLGTGVAPSLSIAENSVLKSYRGPAFSRGPLLRLAARSASYAARPDPSATTCRRRAANCRARDLSGGNLQKLVLGREFSGEPKVLIAASPTRGLDVGAIETVHAYLREAAGEGVAVLLISEDLDEILALSDRIVVIYEGELDRRVRPRDGDGRGDRAGHGRRERERDHDRAPARAAALAERRRPVRLARRRLRS